MHAKSASAGILHAKRCTAFGYVLASVVRVQIVKFTAWGPGPVACARQSSGPHRENEERQQAQPLADHLAKLAGCPVALVGAHERVLTRQLSSHNLQEGIRNRTEPAEPNRTEPFNSGTGRNLTRKRSEPVPS